MTSFLCRWLGHRVVRRRRVSTCRPDVSLGEHRRAVAVEVVEESLQCRRCGLVEMGWQVVSRSLLSSVSWPASMDHEFQKHGRVVTRDTWGLS